MNDMSPNSGATADENRASRAFAAELPGLMTAYSMYEVQCGSTPNPIWRRFLRPHDWNPRGWGRYLQVFRDFGLSFELSFRGMLLMPLPSSAAIVAATGLIGVGAKTALVVGNLQPSVFYHWPMLVGGLGLFVTKAGFGDLGGHEREAMISQLRTELSSVSTELADRIMREAVIDGPLKRNPM